MYTRPTERDRGPALAHGPLAIRRAGDGLVLASRVRVARSFTDRLVGLIGRKGLASGEGLLIHPCNSVHGFFMRFDIDVVHLDGDWRVLHVFRLKRNTVGPVVRGSRFVLELAAGTCERAGLKTGDVLHPEPAVNGNPVRPSSGRGPG